MDIKGIIPAVITPFTDDGKINYNEFARLLEFLFSAGVDGAFISGNAGEFYSLNFDEKIELLRTAKKVSGNNKSIYFGSGCITTNESVMTTQMAEAEGADAVSVITPYLIKPNEDELFFHYKTISDATSLPTLIYNNPAVTGVPVTIGLMNRLIEIENIKGIKDSSGDFALTIEFLRIKKPGFSVLAGRDGLILSTLVHGGSGAISSIASACPEIAVGIYRAYREGDMERAVDLQFRLAELRQLFSRGTFPSIVKEALEMRGIKAGKPRDPIFPLQERYKKELEKMVRDVQNI